MMTTTQNKTIASANENTQVATEIHKVGTAVIGITSILLGGWAVACMTAGIVVNGGPVGLATAYFKALVG
jgi:hypothetical protein